MDRLGWLYSDPVIARYGDRIAAAIFLARTHVTSGFQRQSCVADPNCWVDPLELAGCRNRPSGNVAPDADAHAKPAAESCAGRR